MRLFVHHGTLILLLLAALPFHADASQILRWGYGLGGQYEIPSDLTNAVAVSAGFDHVLALRSDGTVVAWGLESYGQTKVPPGLSNVVQIAAGDYHSLALRTDGSVVAWGNRQDDLPAGLQDVVAIAAGNYSLALKADGSVVGWGFAMDTIVAQPPPTLPALRAVAARGQHALGIQRDGMVVVWGQDHYRITQVPPGLTNAVAVAAGFSHCVALKADGTVVAWGDNRFDQTNVPPGLSDVVAIACHNRSNFTLALRADGTVSAWGQNSGGITDVPSGLTHGRFLAAGDDLGLVIVGEDSPVFQVYPGLQTAYSGRQILFTTLPDRVRPLGHQWLFNGVEIPGATNAFLVKSNLLLADAGHYQVVVDTTAGPVTGAGGELRVIEGGPFIATPPADQLSYQGGAVTLRARVDGSAPFHWRWRLDDQDLPGATGATLTLMGLSPAQTGHYSVTVSNAWGITTSASANLKLAQVWTWGQSNYGQVKNDPDLRDVVAIAGGSHHSLALKRDGTVVAWGGDTGNGQAIVPAGLSDVVGIAAGQLHSLALKADGTVLAWGNNAHGQTNVPSGLSNVVAAAAGSAHCLALQAGGTVVAWGLNDRGEGAVPPFLSDVVAIAAGNCLNLALRANGRVFAWGDNWAGQCDVPVDLTNAVGIAVGGGRVGLAVTSAGKVVTWGDGVTAMRNFTMALDDVVAVAAGGSHVMALRNNGTVVSWGGFYDPWEDNDSSPADTPPGMTNVVAVAAGGIHSLALAGEGPPFITAQPVSRIVMTGGRTLFHVSATGARPFSCQWQVNGANLPGATNATLVLTDLRPGDGGTYRVVVRNPMGTLASNGADLTVRDIPRLPEWKGLFDDPVSLPAGLLDVVDAAFGPHHGLALRRDGTLVTWGEGAHGETNLPPGLSNIVAIAVGESHSVALRSDGTVMAWGDNFYGQTNVPGGLDNVIAITAGYNHNLALRADGTVVGWGDNGDGQTSLPFGDDGHSLATNVVAIAAGEDRSLALRADGTVVAWGCDGDYGMSEPPAGLTNVIAIASGKHDSLALRRDGSAIAWGGLFPSPQEVDGGVAIARDFFHSYLFGQEDLPTLVAVQPSEVRAYTGRTVRLSIMALGLSPLSFQWRFNGQEIPGATNSYLILRDLDPLAQGNYSVVLGSTWGMLGGANADVRIFSGPPMIVRPLVDQVIYPGQRAVWQVETDGTWPCSFQWHFNGRELPGATNATLVLENVSLGDAGEYSVAVNNRYGGVTGEPARLVVAPQTVFAWGLNDHGQINVPQGLTNVVALAGNSEHTLALKVGGTLTGWGYFSYPIVPEGVSNLVAVACGSSHTLALRADGTALAWGHNYYNQTTVLEGLSDVVAIAVGWNHSLVLKRDGTVVCWGGDQMVSVPPGLSNVVAIAAGSHHNLALRSEGTVVSWSGGPWAGTNYCAPPAVLSNVVGIAGGYKQSWALQGDGTVVAWSWPRGITVVVTNLFEGQGRMVAIAAGQHHVLALRENGTVAAAGSDYEGQLQVRAGLRYVVQIAGGYYHSLALVADGRLAPILRLTNPRLEGHSFRVCVPTARGQSYRLEFKDSLSEVHWTPLPPLPGDGQIRELTDPAVPGTARFYRTRLLE